MNTSNPRRFLRPFLMVLIALAASLMLGTCGQSPEPEDAEAPPAISIENPELRLRLIQIGGGLEVLSNEGDQLVLGPSDPALAGEIFFTNKDPEAGQNLPAEVHAHQVLIEGLDGGDYRGSQELVSQLGTTFYSRGRYLEDGAEIEETVIYALHPDADRMMTITYRYPAGADSSVRVQQLIDVLAVVEGL